MRLQQFISSVFPRLGLSKSEKRQRNGKQKTKSNCSPPLSLSIPKRVLQGAEEIPSPSTSFGAPQVIDHDDILQLSLEEGCLYSGRIPSFFNVEKEFNDYGSKKEEERGKSCAIFRSRSMIRTNPWLASPKTNHHQEKMSLLEAAAPKSLPATPTGNYSDLILDCEIVKDTTMTNPRTAARRDFQLLLRVPGNLDDSASEGYATSLFQSPSVTDLECVSIEGELDSALASSLSSQSDLDWLDGNLFRSSKVRNEDDCVLKPAAHQVESNEGSGILRSVSMSSTDILEVDKMLSNDIDKMPSNDILENDKMLPNDIDSRMVDVSLNDILEIAMDTTCEEALKSEKCRVKDHLPSSKVSSLTGTSSLRGNLVCKREEEEEKEEEEEEEEKEEEEEEEEEEENFIFESHSQRHLSESEDISESFSDDDDRSDWSECAKQTEAPYLEILMSNVSEAEKDTRSLKLESGGNDSRTTVSDKNEGSSSRSLRDLSLSLQEKVRHLHEQKLYVDAVFRRAREVDRIRATQFARFRVQFIAAKKQTMLQKLQELQRMLGSQSTRLQVTYDMVLSKQWPKVFKVRQTMLTN